MNPDPENHPHEAKAPACQRLVAQSTRRCPNFNPVAIKPKPRFGAIRERQTYERFGF